VTTTFLYLPGSYVRMKEGESFSVL